MDRPHMGTQSRFHRWSNTQRLVNPREVVMHVKQSNHRDVVINLFTEGIRQAGEASHVRMPGRS